jgi:hypothetical protein
LIASTPLAAKRLNMPSNQKVFETLFARLRRNICCAVP